MTSNQIEFQKLQETQRHNRETERLGTSTLSETTRHNVSTEGIQRMDVQETARHNYSMEGINWYTAKNTALLQSAQAQNQLQQAATEATKRSVNQAAAAEKWENIETMRNQQAKIRQEIQTLADQSVVAAQQARKLSAEVDTTKMHLQEQGAHIQSLISSAEADIERARQLAKETGHIDDYYALAERDTSVREQVANIQQFNAETQRRAQKSRSFRDYVQTGTDVFGAVQSVMANTAKKVVVGGFAP